jgi:hypothetical protein
MKRVDITVSQWWVEISIACNHTMDRYVCSYYVHISQR